VCFPKSTPKSAVLACAEAMLILLRPPIQALQFFGGCASHLIDSAMRKMAVQGLT
jgi:hypothetical protein